MLFGLSKVTTLSQKTHRCLKIFSCCKFFFPHHALVPTKPAARRNTKECLPTCLQLFFVMVFAPSLLCSLLFAFNWMLRTAKAKSRPALRKHTPKNNFLPCAHLRFRLPAAHKAKNAAGKIPPFCFIFCHGFPRPLYSCFLNACFLLRLFKSRNKLPTQKHAPKNKAPSDFSINCFLHCRKKNKQEKSPAKKIENRHLRDKKVGLSFVRPFDLLSKYRGLKENTPSLPDGVLVTSREEVTLSRVLIDDVLTYFREQLTKPNSPTR
jgi:hypothetical protein